MHAGLALVQTTNVSNDRLITYAINKILTLRVKVLCVERVSGVTPMSSTGLEPGAPKRSGYQGGTLI